MTKAMDKAVLDNRVDTVPYCLDAKPFVELFNDEILSDRGQGLERLKHASGSGCAESFRKDVEEGNKEGYFVSTLWLFSLEEEERKCLMSTLWSACYSQIYQTATTTLFARLENDMQPSDNESGKSFNASKGKASIANSPMETGKAKDVPANKMTNDEFPSDDILRNGICDLLKEYSRTDLRKVTFQNIASQLEAKLKVDIRAQKDRIKALILQEASRLLEGALKTERPIFQEAAALKEVDAAGESEEDEGSKRRKRVEEQTSRTVESFSRLALYENFEGQPAQDGLELGHRSGSTTLESMEQKRDLGTSIPTTSVSSSYPAEGQQTTWRSFKAAINGNRHHSFCVGTDWISKLKDDDKEALALICLEAGYEMSHKTRILTWYQRISGNMEKAHGDVGRENNSSTSSGNMDTAGRDVQNPGTSRSGSSTGKNPDQSDIASGSFGPSLLIAESSIQEKNCTCHPQNMRVTCSSSSEDRYPYEIQALPRDRFKKLLRLGDDLVVELPKKPRSEEITTTIHKSFNMTVIDFCNGEVEKKAVKMKGKVSLSLSSCLETEYDRQKVCIKLSVIHGEVVNEISNDQPSNALALNTVLTNLFVSTGIDGEDAWKEISLKLVHGLSNDAPYCRKLLSIVDPETVRDDLVWLSRSDVIPNGCDISYSRTVQLQGDVRKRRKINLDYEVQRAHILRFEDLSPVIFEGEIDIKPKSFLDFRIRQALEVSYYTQKEAIVEGKAYTAECTSQKVDLDCFLDIVIDNVNFG
ncbi:unnamed protein product [Calypogeia fissa]